MANSETSLEVFCEDLFLNIFSKLSEKDLFRCKCVSKEWHQIITNVCIPMLSLQAPVSGVYFRIAKIPGRLGQLMTKSPQSERCQLLNQLANNHSVHFVNAAPLKEHCDKATFEGMSYASILPFDHRGPDFLDCCNGLLLFVHPPKPRFYVCNPAIKQCVPIPLPPPTVHLPSLYASLAFDPSESIHYRIVISLLTTHPKCLLIFYSQTGEWMKHDLQLKLPVPAERFRMVRYCVYLKGMLYRLSMPNNILCFDLEAKTVRLIVCPDKLINLYPRGCFGVLAGSLAYSTREYKHLWVWVLDKHSEQGEWILKYKISFSRIYKLALRMGYGGFLHIWVHPFALHPMSNIVFVGSARTLMMYHLCSGHMEPVHTNTISNIHCGFFFSMFTYKRTLITLKNWCRTPNDLNSCEEVQDNWRFTEQ